jgi:hypothetical protein
MRSAYADGSCWRALKWRYLDDALRDDVPCARDACDDASRATQSAMLSCRSGYEVIRPVIRLASRPA